MTSTLIAAIISWAVTFVCAGVSGILINHCKKLKKQREEKQAADKIREEAQVAGLQALLRAEIIRQHDKYMERGFCPIYAKEALKLTYESYHALGGNGVITKLYEDINKLPVKATVNKKQGGK